MSSHSPNDSLVKTAFRQASRLSRTVCLTLIFVVCCAGIANSQQVVTSGGIGQEQSGGGFAGDLNHWIPEVVMLLTTFLVAAFVFYVIVFRYLLNKANPVWPITAYGWSAAGVIAVTCVIGTFIFWEDLVIGQGGARPFFKEWGGRIGVWVLGSLCIGAILSVFKSPHSRKSKA